MANLNYTAYIDAILAVAQSATPLTVACGLLPPAGGVAAEAAGGNVKMFMDGSAYVRLAVSINVKAAKHDAGCLDALSAVHAALQGAIPSGATWNITGIAIKTPPSYMGQDMDRMHVYTSAIEARIYVRG